MSLFVLILLFAFFALCVVGLFLFASVEAATLSVNRQTLEKEVLEEGLESADVFKLVSNTQRSLSVALVGTHVCAFAGVIALYAALREILVSRAGLTLFPGSVALIAVLLAAPVYLMAADVFGRTLVRRRAAEFLIDLRWLIGLSAAVCDPLLRGCARLAEITLKPFGIDRAVARRPMSVEQIYDMIGRSHESGALKAPEREMIVGAMDLESSNVREVMRPLVDVAAVKIPESTASVALEAARATGYSRFPVFRRRIIEMKEYVDVSRILADGVSDGPLAPYITPAFIVPETMRIDVLLRAFTDQRERCAIVVDEFGGVVGWVTREDVFEEIVGDIADKDADEEPGWTRDEEGRFHVEARMDLDDLNEEIGSRFSKGEDYDTLGGWIYFHHGKVPNVGDVIEEEGARVTVEEMDAHRIVHAVIEWNGESRNGQ